MYNHEPADYQCPYCGLIEGKETEYNSKRDIVWEDEEVLAFISPKWWVNNPGNVIIVPKKHVENIYDIEDDLLSKIQVVAKRIALAMKETYECDGTSTRQHNEPAGNQAIWHYHFHVLPRWKDDDLYLNHLNKDFVSLERREVYAGKLKTYFLQQN